MKVISLIKIRLSMLLEFPPRLCVSFDLDSAINLSENTSKGILVGVSMFD